MSIDREPPIISTSGNQALFKWLGTSGGAVHGGHGDWPLPADGRPGGWTTPVDDPALCARGYHLVRAREVTCWIAPRLFRAEGRGTFDTDGHGGKLAFTQARVTEEVTAWDRKLATLFAVACLEHALPAWRGDTPDKHVPAEVLRTIKDFADGAAAPGALAVARSRLYRLDPDKTTSPPRSLATPAATLLAGIWCLVESIVAGEEGIVGVHYWRIKDVLTFAQAAVEGIERGLVWTLATALAPLESEWQHTTLMDMLGLDGRGWPRKEGHHGD